MLHFICFCLVHVLLVSSIASGQLENKGSSDVNINLSKDCAKVSSAGPQGMPGFPGFPGLPGQKGEVGVNGAVGAKGEVGLKGELGAKGDRGDFGLRGSIGYKGQKGATGATGSSSSSGSGVTYTRWGSTSCRSGASLVYSGRGGGAHYNVKGGGTNFLCMPNDPQYTLTTRSGIQGDSKIEALTYASSMLSSRERQIVPCAVCYAAKQTSLMIPAKTTCPGGWTREYYGYLMSSRTRYDKSEYICLDSSLGYLSNPNTYGAVIYHVEAVCNGFTCPPYDSTKELTCVVCSK